MGLVLLQGLGAPAVRPGEAAMPFGRHIIVNVGVGLVLMSAVGSLLCDGDVPCRKSAGWIGRVGVRVRRPARLAP